MAPKKVQQGRRGARSGKGRAPSFPRITRSVRDLGENRRAIVYTQKIPANLRDLSPRDQVQRLYDLAKTRHGGGVKDYDRLHFFFTFTGTEYNPYTERKMGMATYGTASRPSLKVAAEEFESQLKSIKEGSTAGGDPRLPRVKAAGYGVFRNGPLKIEVHVMERKERKACRGAGLKTRKNGAKRGTPASRKGSQQPKRRSPKTAPRKGRGSDESRASRKHSHAKRKTT